MNAEEMWARSGLTGKWDAWSFGEAPDKLGALVLAGQKTATASAFPLYEQDLEPLPRVGEYSVIMDSKNRALCIIRTTKVYVAPFCEVSPAHAAKEGEGDLSLAYWRQVHRDFFAREMEGAGLAFTEQMPVVCEEFEMVYPK